MIVSDCGGFSFCGPFGRQSRPQWLGKIRNNTATPPQHHRSTAATQAAAGRRQPCATGAGHSGGKAPLNGSELCAAEAQNRTAEPTAAQEQGRQG